MCFVHSKNRPKIRKPLVHTFSYISKRTVKRSYFTFTVKLVPSPGGPSVKWSVPATRESPPSPNGSQLIASGSFCILGYLSVVQYGKNCEYPALCHSDGRWQLFCRLCACSLCYKELFTSSSSLIIIILFSCMHIIISNRPKPNSFTLYMQIYVSQITACL